jgi:starch synthase
MPNLKVLFLSAEVAPIYKVGGLGDVAGTLPPALEKLGLEVTLLTGFYEDRFRKDEYPLEYFGKVNLKWDDEEGEFEIFETVIPGSNVRVLMLKDMFIYGGDIYLKSGNRRRFDLLGLAALELLKAGKIKADLLHVNDVHASLAILLLNQGYLKPKIPTILTLHNLKANFFSYPNELTGFGIEAKKEFIKDGKINRLALAIAEADLINTVSPTFAKEMLTPEFGEGVDGFLREREKDLVGILNGIDVWQFNPETDKDIDATFNHKELAKRDHLREDLFKGLGIEDEGKILLGIVTRLVKQKGVDLIAACASEIVERELKLVLLGDGDKQFEEEWLKIQLKYPENFSINLGFDQKFAKQIYAGIDLFLVPSRFEPCGLTQMMAMRYGALPLAHKVGGLSDTIQDGVDGFLFEEFTKEAFLEALDRAVATFIDKEKWMEMQGNAMKKDFSWEKSAKEYINLYRKALQKYA